MKYTVTATYYANDVVEANAIRFDMEMQYTKEVELVK